MTIGCRQSVGKLIRENYLDKSSDHAFTLTFWYIYPPTHKTFKNKKNTQDACNLADTWLFHSSSDVTVTWLLLRVAVTLNPDAAMLVLSFSSYYFAFSLFCFFHSVASSSLNKCLLIAPLCQQLQRGSFPATCSVYMLGCYIPRILINDLAAGKRTNRSGSVGCGKVSAIGNGRCPLLYTATLSRRAHA